MRICLIYDCLYPHTVGGAERWYRNLAAELVSAGHEVTYLTRRQWGPDERPDVPGVKVIAVSPGGPLYTEGGRRRIEPPLRFGAGVLRHLLAHRGDYDAVHSCAFPFFSLLGARLALAGRPAFVAIDWFEVWTPDYWREYLGALGGRIGHGVQRACVRLTPHAFVFSRLHAQRLREEGLRVEPVVPGGLYAGSLQTHTGDLRERAPLVVFAGRHIREKRADLVPAAVAAARREIPELEGLVLGDGPERPAVLAEIERLGLGDVVRAPGFVSPEEVDRAFERATCLLLPSAREGYGLVVIEAAAAGTPSVLAAGPDNAAVELVAEGVNGFVAPEPEPEALAAAIVAVHRGGPALRERTAAWFAENAPRALGRRLRAPRRRGLRDRAAVGLEHPPGRRAPREAPGLLRAGGAQPVGLGPVVQQAGHRIGDGAGVLGVEDERRAPGDLAQRRAVRAGDRHAANHRLEHGQAEALVERGEDEQSRHGIQRLEVGGGDPAEEAHVVADSQLGAHGRAARPRAAWSSRAARAAGAARRPEAPRRRGGAAGSCAGAWPRR